MQIGLIGAAFAAGLLSFFSPCVLPLLPVYIGLLTTDANQEDLGLGRRIANTIAFVLGISVTFLILGLGAGAIGRALNNSYVAVACGILIFVFGLHLSGFAPIQILSGEKRADARKIDSSKTVGAFLLGLAFSFGWTPCIGPILGSVLALASQQGTAVAGAALTLVYALGMCIPFVVITLASGILLAKVRKLNKYLPVIQRIGGALIAIMGLWMVFSQVHELANSANTDASDLIALVQPSESSDADTQNGGGEETTEADSWRYMTVTDLDGQEHRMQDYVGKPLYIEFWGSWCTVCMENLDEFSATAQRLNDAGDVQVVSVVAPGHYGEMEEDEFMAWAREEGLAFPVFMDPDDQLGQFFALSAYPTSVFVDSDGSVELVRAGAIDPSELEDILASLS
jgi:cytochrome c-type biogenesis protein